jgi:hypothetical protein
MVPLAVIVVGQPLCERSELMAEPHTVGAVVDRVEGEGELGRLPQPWSASVVATGMEKE